MEFMRKAQFIRAKPEIHSRGSAKFIAKPEAAYEQKS